MILTFLGTGNALPSAERSNTALILAEQRNQNVIMIDCGGDPFRNLIRNNIAAQQIDALIITHAHIDHIGGLPSLIESLRIAGRTAPLPIFGISHVLDIAQRLLDVYSFELTLAAWPFAITFHEIAAGQTSTVGDFSVLPMKTMHTVPSIGLRIQSSNTTNGPLFAYTSDTMNIPELLDIARDASLFIAEATYFKGMEDEAAFVRHMTVQQAALIAEQAHASALGLVHLSVRHADENRIYHEAHATYGGKLIIPRDNETYTIEQRHISLTARAR